MWVSVLVLGAAEHPVSQLLGPQYPCCPLSMTASSPLYEVGPALLLRERGRDNVRAACKGPRCIWTWCAWIMTFVNENMYLWECAFGWKPSHHSLVSEALAHSGSCGPVLRMVYLASSQSAAVLCRTVLCQPVRGLITCKESESLIFKCALSCDCFRLFNVMPIDLNLNSLVTCCLVVQFWNNARNG